MKRLSLFAVILLSAVCGFSQTRDDKVLYSLGYLLGDNIKKQLVLESEDDFKAISQGMRDSLLDRASQTDLATYKPLVVKKYEEDRKTKLSNRKKEQQEYLNEARKDKKNQVLSNGAMIRIIEKGKGNTPDLKDTVTVHYTGKLIGGKQFDSSEGKGPAKFPLLGVIPCWTEALQQMKAGSKAKLICPSDTAYGDADIDGIEGGSVLLFDVELIEIDKAKDGQDAKTSQT